MLVPLSLPQICQPVVSIITCTHTTYRPTFSTTQTRSFLQTLTGRVSADLEPRSHRTRQAATLPGSKRFDADGASVGLFDIAANTGDPEAAFIGFESTDPVHRVEVSMQGTADGGWILCFFLRDQPG